MWNNILLIFLGGGLGSVLRFLISHAIVNRANADLPWGTLIVNVLGSFLLGLIIAIVHKMNWSSSQLIVFFTIGFCGGFTTFSTFTYENMLLIKNGDYLQLLLYVLASVILGILAAFGGFLILK